MAAPRFASAGLRARRNYTSPDVVPDAWAPDRPAEIDGLQPSGPRLGAQGPDQGFALRIAAQLASRVHVTDGEDRDDAVRGSLGVALSHQPAPAKYHAPAAPEGEVLAVTVTVTVMVLP